MNPRHVCLALLLMFLAAGCGGQSFKPAPDRKDQDPCQMAKMDSTKAAGGYMAILTKRLRLSPQQAADMKTVLLNERHGQEQIDQKYSRRQDREGQMQMQSLLSSLERQTESRLASILSEAQVDAYHRFLSEMARRCSGARHGRSGAPQRAGERGRPGSF